MADEPTEDRREFIDSLTGAPFGPGFFLGQLRAFARDRCPDPAEMLPAVELHLASGQVLDVCHVMGLAPSYVALAVREAPCTGTHDGSMRTELVPYGLITRVTIRAVRPAGPHVGFSAVHSPHVIGQDRSPEAALKAASGAPDRSADT